MDVYVLGDIFKNYSTSIFSFTVCFSHLKVALLKYLWLKHLQPIKNEKLSFSRASQKLTQCVCGGHTHSSMNFSSVIPV